MTRRTVLVPVLLLVAAVASMLAGAWWVCPAGACQVTDFDRTVLTAAHAARSPGADLFFEAITWFGSLATLLPLSLAWLVWRRPALGGRTAAFVLMAVVGAALLAHGVKLGFDRPRPDLFANWIGTPPDASFPSAHTLQALSFVLAVLLQPGLSWSPRVWPWAVLTAVVWVLAVAASRLYLQVHYPSDVVFGAIAALLWVMALRAWPGWTAWPLASSPPSPPSAPLDAAAAPRAER